MITRKVFRRRRGAIAPLSALLAAFLLGMVAFAIDIAWIVLTEDELQNVADASALAGVQALLDPYVQYQLPGQSESTKQMILANAMTAARADAKTYAAYNSAGGVKMSILDSDIEFGFMDSANNYTPYSSITPQFPNTIKVVTRRDATANGSLKLFFAPVLGTSKSNLTATASASLYAGVVNSFNPKSTSNIGLLPVTFDVARWDDFLTTGKDAWGDKNVDSNGVPQLKVYSSNKDKGNFGLLSLDDAHAGASEVRDWVNNGLPPSAVQTLIDNKLIPLSAHDATKWDWRGENGFKASVVMDINQYIGKEFILPLYQAKSQNPYQAGVGQGSNYDYNIVRFVGVRLMYTSDTNREIIVQPTGVIDPGIVFQTGTVVPAGSTTGTSNFSTTFTTAKLTR
jgi:Flp pilus assembly protein TadG